MCVLLSSHENGDLGGQESAVGQVAREGISQTTGGPSEANYRRPRVFSCACADPCTLLRALLSPRPRSYHKSEQPPSPGWHEDDKVAARTPNSPHIAAHWKGSTVQESMNVTGKRCRGRTPTRPDLRANSLGTARRLLRLRGGDGQRHADALQSKRRSLLHRREGGGELGFRAATSCTSRRNRTRSGLLQRRTRGHEARS